MAAIVAEAKASQEGITATFTSAGVSNEEAGNPLDPRAVKVLTGAGYQPAPHSAHLVTAEEVLAADLVIGMEELHLEKVRQLTPGAQHLYLLTDFDPNAVPGSEIADPWYGDEDDFVITLRQIEGAMPEMMKRTRELLP